MKKVNEIVYKKLLLQAEEAKEQGLEKLASGILSAIGSMPEDEAVEYGYDSMGQDVYEGLWKLSSTIIRYYDLDSIDAEKLNATIESLASQFVEEIENTLQVESNNGPFEPQIPGESK